MCAAFRETAKRYPLYGKADGLDPSDWWTLIIERTFDEAGIAGSGRHAVSREADTS